MILYGKNSIYERLKKNPSTIKKVVLAETFRATHIEDLIKENGISVERLAQRDLAKIKPSKDLQGIIAKVRDFEYTPYNELLNRRSYTGWILIFLDRINDPQNLGSIIRTLACFGGFGAVIPQYEACEVTEAVLHVASGGENYVPISKVANLSNAIIAAKKKDYWIAGAVINDSAETIDKADLPFPLGLVLGSEGKGIRHGLEKQLDISLRIPMDGVKLSFNVAMACAIFCHEISKKRKTSN